MKKFNSIVLIFLLAGIAFGQNLRGTDIKQISNITPGTVTASKALVVDANRNIATIRNLTAEGIVTTDTLMVGALKWDMPLTDSLNGAVNAAGTIPSTSIVLQKDLVTTSPITGGVDNILPGTDSDVTIAITVLKDIVASGTGMSGGADDVLPGADADVTITLTTAKDLVTTSPLAGGTDNILPGTDSDVTLSIADAAADGSTKGAAAFATNDFEATTGVVSIDYTNGQAASGSNKGFLTSADWTTFNGKQAGDATLTALAGLTIADVSVIEGTGADAVNMVSSGGANYMLASDGTNAALSFIAPATVLSNIGAQATDATLTALAGLTIADVSIIEGTGTDAVAMVASGGNNYILGSNSDNSALEFKAPATVLSNIGAQASDATLTALAGLTVADVSIIEGTGADAVGMVASGGNNYILGSNSDNTALEFKASTGTGSVVLNGAPTFTGLIKRSVTASITASTTQSQGQGALTTDINEVSVVGNANDVVTLPTAVAGMEIFIINNGANTLQIFPATDDNLGAGVNTSTTLNAASNITFVSYDATNWEVK